MKLFNAIAAAVVISMAYTIAPPSSFAATSRLNELNKSSHALMLKIKELNLARTNARAAGEKKIACDFHALIALTTLELMTLHKEKSEIYASNGMNTTRQREISLLAKLDEYGRSEYASFNKTCR